MLFYFQSYTAFVAIMATLVSLDVVAVLTRLGVRRALRQKLWLDDWLVIPALFLNIGLAIAVFIGVADKVLTHRYPTTGATPADKAIGRQKTRIALKIDYAITLMSMTNLAMIKISALFLYKRVFVYDKHNWKDRRNMFFNLLILLTTIWGSGFVLTGLTACRDHFSATYTSLEDLRDKCINTMKYQDAYAISDFVIDCLILLTPIPFVWKLQLSIQRRIGILIIFLLGTLSAVSSLIRMIWIHYIVDSNDSSISQAYINSADMLIIAISTEMFWYSVEAKVGLLAVCLPPISGIRKTAIVDGSLSGVRKMFERGEETRRANEKEDPGRFGIDGHREV